MKRALIFLFLIPALALAGWAGLGAYLAAMQPSLRIERVTPLSVSGERTLPFYELMSPLPPVDGYRFLPKLEYKKGPPTRFIERLTLLVRGEKGAARERVIYHGRRTRDDLAGFKLFARGSSGTEAHYLEAAFLVSQGLESGLPKWKYFLLRPLLLREAGNYLEGMESVQIMEQAGVPAFLFLGKSIAGEGAKSFSLFVRRSSFYRIDYLSDKAYSALQPENFFRRSFLVNNRADAMEYLGRNLAEIQLDQTKIADPKKITWPLLLLAAKVSVDPASIESYFHFAGLNALLYRSTSMDAADPEALDILRNNVLAAEFYARDINPNNAKSLEIARLARQLTRNLE